MQKKQLYDYPDYYDTAFSFRDLNRESEVFDECIKQYSRIPVKSVLEVGSGTAPHMEEWVRRGIEYVGIDTSKNMLSYARRKAEKLQIPVSIQEADMRSFSLGRTVDFAYILLGSLWLKTSEDIDSHFDSVARALKPGGLYFLDWCINFQWAEPSGTVQSWSAEKGRLKVDVSFRTELLDRAGQMVRNILSARVDDNGRMVELETIDEVKTIFPQEFLLRVEKSRKFEFVGWWNHWNLAEPVEEASRISRPITLLRRNNTEET